MEKIKGLLKNKKAIIAIIAVVVAVVLVVALVPKLLKPSYKSQIKKWAKACESEEKMEKYVKKNANLKAEYALAEVLKDAFSGEIEDEDEIPKAFEKEYKKAKKSDYMDKDFIEDITGSFYDEDYEGVKIKKIGKLEKSDDDDGLSLKGAKSCEIEAEIDGDEYEGTAAFYKGKIVSISLYKKD